ncbi:MAG: energy-coupling factor transporter transmembrane protein EcfT [Candidatus Coatesbacteria bacterium]|nr:MAG: energy-coupling factor transporter transmembrane protein EcfT [Candidatus Coatesbacteria bacterium]
MSKNIRRLHPLTKILWLLGGLVLLLVFNDPIYLSAVFAAAVIFAVIPCRIGRQLIKAVPLLVVFFIASLIIWPPFIKSGVTWFSLGPYVVTIHGTAYAAAMGLRIAGTVVVALCFASTTSPEEFAAGLRSMKAPSAISFTLSLAFRLLPVVAETTARVVESQKARGVAFSGGLVRRMKLYLPLIVPVVLLNLRGSDQMAIGLELRGFAPSKRPVPHDPPRSSVLDVMAVFVLILLIASALAARLAGYGAIIPDRI